MKYQSMRLPKFCIKKQIVQNFCMKNVFKYCTFCFIYFHLQTINNCKTIAAQVIKVVVSRCSASLFHNPKKLSS